MPKLVHPTMPTPLGLGQKGNDCISMELWKKKVVDFFSFFVSAWDMTGCEDGGMMMMFIMMGWCFGASWEVERGGKGRRLEYHEKENFSRSSPINICLRDWRQDPQVVGWWLFNTLQQKVSLYAKWFH